MRSRLLSVLLLLCCGTAPPGAVRGRPTWLSLRISARPLQSSWLPDRVVVLHRQREIGGWAQVRFRADVFPAGCESRPSEDLGLGRPGHLPCPSCIERPSGGRFYHTERVNRAGPGLAGASEPMAKVWNGNWQVTWVSDRQEIQAVADNFALRLVMTSRKPPVIHGKNGVSQKAAGAGQASHYISFTRLLTSGSIETGREELPG